jgi:hypothetical protein
VGEGAQGALPLIPRAVDLSSSANNHDEYRNDPPRAKRPAES